MYQITITGTATREEIAKALRVIADAIHHPTSKGDGLNVYIGEYLEATDYSLTTTLVKK